MSGSPFGAERMVAGPINPRIVDGLVRATNLVGWLTSQISQFR